MVRSVVGPRYVCLDRPSPFNNKEMRKRFNQGHIVILLFKHCRTSRWMVAGPLQEAGAAGFLTTGESGAAERSE